MKNAEHFFSSLSFDKAKLLHFGFGKNAAGYTYTRQLPDNPFEIHVVIDASGHLTADVIDGETKEIYVPVKIPDAGGALVGRLRSAYDSLLEEIADACCYRDIFKSGGAQKLLAYARKKYGSEPEFLWPKFPGNAVLRRSDTKKWYAALIKLPAEKIGLDGEQLIEIADLRCPTEKVEATLDGKTYFPGYHMNKKSWITLCLETHLDDKELYRRLDESYELARK